MAEGSPPRPVPHTQIDDEAQHGHDEPEYEGLAQPVLSRQGSDDTAVHERVDHRPLRRTRINREPPHDVALYSAFRRTFPSLKRASRCVSRLLVGAEVRLAASEEADHLDRTTLHGEDDGVSPSECRI
jgi:hypothetical protein